MQIDRLDADEAGTIWKVGNCPLCAELNTYRVTAAEGMGPRCASCACPMEIPETMLAAAGDA